MFKVSLEKANHRLSPMSRRFRLAKFRFTIPFNNGNKKPENPPPPGEEMSISQAKIRDLEEEYYLLMSASPPDVARACDIISTLAKLYHAQEKSEEEAARAEAAGNIELPELQKSLDEMVAKTKLAMSAAGDKQELDTAFTEGLYRLREILDEQTFS